jgi:hypothetical protein
LNLVSTDADVLAQLRREPLLLAILATDPPKSSSRYVQVNLGILESEVMWRKRCSLGLILQDAESAALQ